MNERNRLNKEINSETKLSTLFYLRRIPMRTFLIMCASLSLFMIACGDETSSESNSNMMNMGGNDSNGGMINGGEMVDGGDMMGDETGGGDMINVPMIPTEEIQAIFDTKCLSCHGTAGRLALDNFESKTLSVDSTVPGLVLIVPGNHQESYLWHKVNRSHIEAGGNGSPMPLGVSLDPSEITKIAQYIDGLE